MFDLNFKGDSYDTPENTKRMLRDYLSLNSRIFFFYRILKLISDTNHLIREKGEYSLKDWSESSYYAFKSVEGCGCKIHLKGILNIEKNPGPVVFIGNHMSTLETFLLPGILCPRKPSSFVAKKELVESKLFGLIMRSTYPVVVGRKSPMEDLKSVLSEGVDKLKSGRSMIVFPQHTRNAVFKPEEFNTIGVKLAKKADVKIIPIALKTDFWSNGTKIKDFGPIYRGRDVYIKFGEPLTAEGNGKETHNQIVEFIKTNLLSWGGTVD